MRTQIIASTLLFWMLTLVDAQNISVLTQRYNNRRLGWNDYDTILNTKNVNPLQFGFIFSRPVDDQIYAQPLIAPGLVVNGTRQNVVFIATVNNTLYAFNAEDSLSSSPLWQLNLTPAGSRVIKNTDMTGACGGAYFDFSGNIGIVGTPVIDTNTLTIFVVARSFTLSSHHFEQYLHKINILTGEEKPGSPVLITAKVRGSGGGSINDSVSFDEQKENQRSALLLLNGNVYVCWASHCDWDPYHGWMIGFDTATLEKKIVYNATPDGFEGGIWMSGGGPVVDENGFIYLITGNGTVGNGIDENNLRNRGESFLKMIPSGDSMKIIDFFTPNNYSFLEQNDLDYGIDGPLLIPNSSISVSGSKAGVIYLLNDNQLGRYSSNNDSVLQEINIRHNQFGNTGFIHGTPVYYRYHNESDTECVYVWGASDSLFQFFFDRSSGRFDLSSTIKGTHPIDIELPGAMLSVSSKDTTAGTGILWASHPTTGNANQSLRPGTLEAYDARNVKQLLWSSDLGPASNKVGIFSKFNTPVVANGKVYQATFSNKLSVYGLFKTPIVPVSVNSISPISDFSVFPNPAHESARIEFNLANSEDDLEFRIFDLSGRLVYTTTSSGRKGYNLITLDLKQLSEGAYMVVIASKGLPVHTAKLIID